MSVSTLRCWLGSPSNRVATAIALAVALLAVAVAAKPPKAPDAFSQLDEAPAVRAATATAPSCGALSRSTATVTCRTRASLLTLAPVGRPLQAGRYDVRIADTKFWAGRARGGLDVVLRVATRRSGPPSAPDPLYLSLGNGRKVMPFSGRAVTPPAVGEASTMRVRFHLNAADRRILRSNRGAADLGLAPVAIKKQRWIGVMRLRVD